MHYPLLRSRYCQHLCSDSTNPVQHSLPVSTGPSQHRIFCPDTGLIHDFHRCCAFVLIFIEVPFLLRICPTSTNFDNFIRRFTTNYMRAAVYTVMSAVQWVSLVSGASSLIVAAVFLLIAACFYLLAGIKNQEFVSSKTLGGQGLAQMIV